MNAADAAEHIECDCCIAGGGPAGMMLAVLLARAGLHVVILEKHVDFLRDFRGDTIHPSTLQIMHEMGVLQDFLKRPHTKLKKLRGFVSGMPVTLANFSHLPVECKYIAMMPQWDFLNFLAEQGSRYDGFDLRREADVQTLVHEGARVCGVVAKTPRGALHVRAQLVIGADGRTSTVRSQAGLEVKDLGASIDVLWMQIPKRDSDPDDAVGFLDRGRMVVLLDRGDYWQSAYVIAKGGLDDLKARGIDAFRKGMSTITPFLSDRVDALDWPQLRLLTVTVNRLTTWYVDGLLFIGDAAHAMSPIGGVGINLAVQDAVAAANVLATPLRNRAVYIADLKAVQDRREMPTRLMQGLQVTVQNRVISAALQRGADAPSRPPLAMQLFRLLPLLQRIPARVVGLGFRPEHVHTDVA